MDRLVELRLAARLLRGAGRRDWLRLAAMTLGVGVAVFATLIGLAAPRVASQAEAVEIARAARLSDSDSTTGLHVSSSQVMVHGLLWTKVTASGVTGSSPLPPGVHAWPRLGTSIVSPALARLIARGDIAQSAVGNGAVLQEHIGEEGLTGPDELYSYSVAPQDSTVSRAPGEAPDSTPAVEGFGNPSAAPSQGSTAVLLIEVGVLVLTPAVLFLLTALRLSAASRGRRSFALGLAGMSPERNARLYATEMSLLSLVGGVIGMLTYQRIEGTLGESGLLGVKWWPQQGALGPVTMILTLAATVLLVRLVAKRSMMAAATQTRSQMSRQPGTKQLLLALAVGSPSIGFLALVAINGFLHPSEQWATDSWATWIAVAIVGSVVGVAVGVPSLVSSLGVRWAARLYPPLALGIRGAAFRAGTTKRLIAFVACAVMLSGLSAAFMAGLRIGALGAPDQATISFDLAQVQGEPGWPGHLPSGPYTIDTTSASEAGDYAVVIGDCTAIERQAKSVFAQPGRRINAVQIADGGIGGGTAHELTFGSATVPISAANRTSHVTWDVKVPRKAAATWLSSVTSGEVTYWVPRNSPAYQKTLDNLASRFPGLQVQAGLKNPDQFAAYEQQIGIVRSAAILGITLSVFSFLLATLESRWERTRSVASLSAIGAPRRALRLANAAEFAFPILVAAIPSIVVGILGGWAVLSFRGSNGMFSTEVVGWTLLGIGSSTVVTIAFGWATGGGKFTREAIADA